LNGLLLLREAHLNAITLGIGKPAPDALEAQMKRQAISLADRLLNLAEGHAAMTVQKAEVARGRGESDQATGLEKQGESLQCLADVLFRAMFRWQQVIDQLKGTLSGQAMRTALDNEMRRQGWPEDKPGQ
jgi:hypothetical protein